MKFFQKKQGFTLIELLITVSIVIILSTFMYVSLNPTKRKTEARNAKRWGDVNLILDNITRYMLNNNGDISKLGLSEDNKYYMLGTYGLTDCNYSCRNSVTTESNCTDIYNYGTSGELKFGDSLYDASSLVSVWHLNESAGGIADSKGLNTGVYNGDLYNQPGKLNSGLGFDGTDDAVLISKNASLNITNSITVAAWMKYTPDKQYPRIVSQDTDPQGWELYVDDYPTTNKITFHLREQTGPWGNCLAQSDIQPTSGEWYHVVGVYNPTANRMEVYVNGELKGTDTVCNWDGISLSANYDVAIGAKSDLAANKFFSGVIDEVAIWNVPLSAKQISELYGDSFTNYLSPLPYDSVADNSAISSSGWSTDRTGYWVRRNSRGKIEVGACEPEDTVGGSNYPDIKVSF